MTTSFLTYCLYLPLDDATTQSSHECSTQNPTPRTSNILDQRGKCKGKNFQKLVKKHDPANASTRERGRAFGACRIVQGANRVQGMKKQSGLEYFTENILHWGPPSPNRISNYLTFRWVMCMLIGKWEMRTWCVRGTYILTSNMQERLHPQLSATRLQGPLRWEKMHHQVCPKMQPGSKAWDWLVVESTVTSRSTPICVGWGSGESLRRAQAVRSVRSCPIESMLKSRISGEVGWLFMIIGVGR